MRFRRRRSLLPRVGRRPSPEDVAPLKGQLWTRSERNLREPDVHPIRRIIAVAVATGECALLGWLWLGPLQAGEAVRSPQADHRPHAPQATATRAHGSPPLLPHSGESGPPLTLS